MYVDVNTIITAASLLAAIGAIFSVVFAVYRWYLRQNRQDTEIEKLKSELKGIEFTEHREYLSNIINNEKKNRQEAEVSDFIYD